MSLPGLEDIKAFFLHAKAKVQAATRRGIDLKDVNFDVVFTGNEGTGKTAIANLYANFLASLGLVKPRGAQKGIEKFSAYGFSKTRTLDSMRTTISNRGGCVSHCYNTSL